MQLNDRLVSQARNVHCNCLRERKPTAPILTSLLRRRERALPNPHRNGVIAHAALSRLTDFKNSYWDAPRDPGFERAASCRFSTSEYRMDPQHLIYCKIRYLSNGSMLRIFCAAPSHFRIASGGADGACDEASEYLRCDGMSKSNGTITVAHARTTPRTRFNLGVAGVSDALLSSGCTKIFSDHYWQAVAASIAAFSARARPTGQRFSARYRRTQAVFMDYKSFASDCCYA